VVTYWTRTNGVVDRILVKSKCFFLSCSRHDIILRYTENYYIKVLFSENLQPYGPIASCASVDPTSQVCSPAMLVLLIVVPNGTTSMPDFIQIRQAILELNHADRHT
jgi:hypothetical protein